MLSYLDFIKISVVLNLNDFFVVVKNQSQIKSKYSQSQDRFNSNEKKNRLKPTI